MTDWTVAITTYNRPELLLRLLSDLEREGRHPDVSSLEVVVFDDCSEPAASYAPVAQRCLENGWGYRRSLSRGGKERYWEMTERCWALARPGRLFFLLQDDLRLARGALGQLAELWAQLRAADPQAMTLTPLVVAAGGLAPRWTKHTPSPDDDVGQHLVRTQWADGIYVCDAALPRVLAGRCPPIRGGKDRWRKHPGLSSGVGEAITRGLHRAGFGMYSTRRSYVWHDPGESTMHPETRRKQPLETLDFVDPGLFNLDAGAPAPAPAAASRARRRREPADIELTFDPSEPDIVWGDVEKGSVPVLARRRPSRPDTHACMVALHTRQDQARKAISSIVDQVDYLTVYLNGWERPAWMPDRVGTTSGDNVRGDASKVFPFIDNAAPLPVGEYVILCDDDMVYPQGFVQHLVAGIERYDREAVVGLHGVCVDTVRQSYYSDRQVMHWQQALTAPAPVHLVATSCCAWWSGALHLTWRDFPAPNMADIWLGIACQRQRVPVVCLEHPADWLQALPVGDAIYDQARRDDALQTGAVLATRWALQVPRRMGGG